MTSLLGQYHDTDTFNPRSRIKQWNLVEQKQTVNMQWRQTSVTPVPMFNIVNWRPADAPRCIEDSFSVITVCKLHRQLQTSDDTIQSAWQLTVPLLSRPVIDVPAMTCRSHRKPTWNACNKQAHTSATHTPPTTFMTTFYIYLPYPVVF